MTFDVTTNRIQFGLLTKEEKAELRAWPHGWDFRDFVNGWCNIVDPSWADKIVYRGKPVPREPKAIWVNEYQDFDGYAFSSESEAKRYAARGVTRIAVKYQEVI